MTFVRAVLSSALLGIFLFHRLQLQLDTMILMLLEKAENPC